LDEFNVTLVVGVLGKAARLKFQFTFDLLPGQWLETNLKPYPIPDQSPASGILFTVLQAGDLIIREGGA